ncbi:RebB family R body protein [Rheinheimera sp. F8]|uniref:RebB family R body protein n=1 Tax=Rheinheimera sp. F8 TaxID=1763998 RepID=UPI0007448916|nr:RebB family R body protein [Rheinheimera sp. F8]ALZ74597.1 hypothetical protein ATY27_01690 [Rheinheimera sp. F8]
MTEINQAIGQSVALVNALTLGMAPAMALGSQYQHLAYNVGLAALNQQFAQQQANITHQATTVASVLHNWR